MEVLPQPGLLFTLASYLLLIGILVVVHEGGHYLAGRLFGVRIDSYALGFGKELLGYTDRRGTRWRLNAIPLGGYVKFTGDINAASEPSPEILALPLSERADLFVSKPLWQRAIIVAAGPVINFVFAILVFAGLYLAVGHPMTPPIIDGTAPGGPAAAAGLRAGDRITAIGSRSIDRFEDVMDTMALNTGTPVTVRFARGSEALAVTFTPRIVDQKDFFGNVNRHGQLGVALRPGRQVTERVGPIDAVVWAVRDTGTVVRSIFTSLGQIVSGQRSIADLGGPIKSGQITGQQASLGVLPYIFFMAFFSINLGVINLLPIPMLDGGHLFLYAVEAFRRQPLGAKVQEWAFMSGFAALMSLMAILTWNDLGSVGVFKRLAGWLG